MSKFPIDEQAVQQDTLQRLQRWMQALEERVLLLLQSGDPLALKPNECEQAVNRHLDVLLKIAQMCLKGTDKAAVPDRQQLLAHLMRSEPSETSAHTTDQP
jgi:hypothetical protein